MMDTKIEEPCDGLAAHEKVLAQFHKLTGEDGFLVQTVMHVKESNELAKVNNTRLRILSLILAFCVMVLIGLVVTVSVLLRDINALENKLSDTLGQIDKLGGDVQTNSAKMTEVKQNSDEMREVQDSQPRVELVPEPDPVKARSAPIKVRITPGKSDAGAPEPAASTVEVPLPTMKEGTPKK